MNSNQETLLSVPLDKLRAFDLNPRITRNKNYDEIKESIRNRGLEHLLQITQRPGENFYIIASGGNTRLAILNELWLETQDKKYWDIVCLLQPWTAASLEQGNFHYLVSHLIENQMRGNLTFTERALAVQNAINLHPDLNHKHTQHDIASILSQEGYPLSQTVLSIMHATVHLLLPYIPDLLYSGLTRKHIDQILSLRANGEKFWDKHCQGLSPADEQTLPLFDDLFAMALTPFNGPAAGFVLEHIRDELTGLISQTLSVDYNTVALAMDPRAQQRTSLLGHEATPELPDISEQRPVAMKYQQPAEPGQRKHKQGIKDDDDENVPSLPVMETDAEKDEYPADTPLTLPPSGSRLTEPPALSTDDPLTVADSPEALASFIDQEAWELAGNAGLEFLISPSDSGLFDIATPEKSLSNEETIYWQLLSFLAGKLSGSATIWRQMLIGNPNTPAGFDEDTLLKIFQLIRNIRHLYAMQQGRNTA